MPSKGVIYYATNKESYVDQALMAARSVKETSPEIEVAVFTNLEEYAAKIGAGVFDKILHLEPQTESKELLFLDKLLAIQASPFDHTLYLDSDTYVFDDLNDMFRLLERFQIVITHGHNRRLRDLAARGKAPDHKGRKRDVLGEECPVSFGAVQGGFLLYRKNDPAVQNWIEETIAQHREDDFYDDQVTWRKMLWRDESISLYALPLEYNFTGLSDFKIWKRSGFKAAVPVIMHYTEHKDDPWPAIKAIKPYAGAMPRASFGSVFKKISKKLKR